MLLTELREQIEQGKVAQLFIPKTHEHGIDVTIKVLKKESQFIWQREKIEEPTIPLNLPAITSQFESWEKLIEALQGGMQLRDGTWEIEKLIEDEDSQLIDTGVYAPFGPLSQTSQNAFSERARQLREDAHPLEPMPAPSSGRDYPDLEGE